MKFNDTKPIYIQIADFVCDQIINLHWPCGDRIPSVRELGSRLEVNPNTIMRSFEWLAEHGIIYNRRGIGFFVCDEAIEVIRHERKEKLMMVDLRQIAISMLQLNASTEEITKQLEMHIDELKRR